MVAPYYALNEYILFIKSYFSLFPILAGVANRLEKLWTLYGVEFVMSLSSI
jgi:hypothetical protein